MNINRRALRADARRNRLALLDAAVATLNEAPRATMDEIAATAQVSRATMYAHFANRDDLVSAAFRWSRAAVDEQLAALDPDISVSEALGQLVRSGWPTIGRFAGVAAVAGRGIAPLELLIRGRAEGAFRSDQPVRWQTQCFYVIVRTGAAQIRDGTLTEAQGVTAMLMTISAMLAAAPEGSEEGAPALPAASTAPL